MPSDNGMNPKEPPEAVPDRQLQEAILESMEQGFAVYDGDHRLVSYNRQFVDLFSFPPGFLRLGMAYEEIIRYRAERGDYGEVDVEEKVKYRLEQRSKKIQRRSSKFSLPDGTVFVAHRRLMPDGGIIVTYSDITALQRAEQEAVEKSMLLEAALGSMAQGFVAYDAENKLVAFNDQVNDIFGHPPGFLKTGMTHEETIRFRVEHGYYGDGDQKELTKQALLRSQNRIERTLEVQSVIGKTFVYHRRPMPNGGFMNTFTDITEQKQAEEKLHQARKMEALGQLTGGVAHEFNNLLQVVIGNLDLLTDDLKDMERPRERVERIKKAAFEGKELTDRLLSFTGKQLIRPQVIDTGDFVESTAVLLRPMFGEKIEAESKTADHLWPINVDPGQLQAAILNIVINARDAMPEGGKLTIETANISLDNVVAVNHAQEMVPGNYVLISIADTGTGMPNDVSERAFDPFFTTKEVGQGTGLGLSMVFGFITKQCGGFIDIDSAVGRGTTVRLYLPRVVAATNAGEAPAANEMYQGNKSVVLVVEDNTGVLGLTAESLERRGYTVLQTETGADALAMSKQTDRIDILLADIVLRGGMNGIEVARTLRQARPDLKVIYMTGHSEDVINVDGDVDAPLLRKPFELERLLQLTEELLEGRDTQGTDTSC